MTKKLGPWTTIDSTLIHETPFLRLREDRVRLPNGHETQYGVVDTGECVGVLPFVDPDHVVLVRQFRYIAQRVTWEMPTGGVHDGETTVMAAQRELEEEAGYHAAELTPISTYHTSKSSIDETAHLFIGRGLTPCEARPDDTEDFEIHTVPFVDALQMVLSGAITDSMTIIAVLIAGRDGS